MRLRDYLLFCLYSSICDKKSSWPGTLHEGLNGKAARDQQRDFASYVRRGGFRFQPSRQHFPALYFTAVMLFYQRNWLPSQVADSPSLSVFKRRLDDALINML